MLTIARFNWPFYAMAFAVTVASIAGGFLLHSASLKILSGVAFLTSAYFLIGSLSVSHFVYDRSDLYRWGWLERALHDAKLQQAILCHCGFDEASPDLVSRFRDVQWRILDHFDPKRMTEASILRARAIFPPYPGALTSRYDTWPLDSASADVVFGLLAIHELRRESERTAWFMEARRCLRKGGRVLLVEHLRNTSNFLAFGPGFLHFHSASSWRRCWQRGGLRCVDQFCVTPFVWIFVLTAV